MPQDPYADTIARFTAEIKAAAANALRIRLARKNRMYKAGYLWARETASYHELTSVIWRDDKSVVHTDGFKIPGFYFDGDWPAFVEGARALYEDVRDQLP